MKKIQIIKTNTENNYCPYCSTPTKRQYLYSTADAVYNPVILDENGNYIDNKASGINEYYKCLKCGNQYKAEINKDCKITVKPIDL